MKKILTLFAALVLLAVGATAQKLSYSAVVRNSANELVANKTLTVSVSIANSATGAAVYSETQSATTNQNGLLTLTIGEGASHTGSLNDVTWATAYITTTYTIDNTPVTNTVAVNAVPYALYAENAGNSTQVNADWEATSGAAEILHKPMIPTVNDGTLTIKQGDVTLGTFTANQSGPTVVNIPTSTYTLTAGDLINVISNMTADEKAQLCQALNCSGTTPPTPMPDCPNIIEGATGTIFSVTSDGVEVMAYTSDYVYDNASVTDYGFRIVTVTTDNTETETEFLTIRHSTDDDFVFAGVDHSADMPYIGARVNMGDLPDLTGKSLDELAAVGTHYRVYPVIFCNGDDIVGSPADYTVQGGGDEPTPEPTHPNCGTMTDVDGNIYQTVVIGTQCWTKTNMRSSRDKNGNIFINGITAAANSFDKVADSVVYIPTTQTWNENNSTVTYNDSIFGYYYNWEAAKLVCPSGWHLPSHAEWITMANYVSDYQEGGAYKYRCDQTDFMSFAKALATTSGWTEIINVSDPCVVGYNQSANNGTGYSAVPAGSWFGGYNSGFKDAGLFAYFWTSTADVADYAWIDCLLNDNESPSPIVTTTRDGFSVRCLKDDANSGGETSECPTLGDASATLTNGMLFVETSITGTYDNSAVFHYDIQVVDDNTFTPVTVTPEIISNVMYLAHNGYLLSQIEYDFSGKTITITPSCTCQTATGDQVVTGGSATVNVPASTTPTTFTCGTDKMEDANHNFYETVQIGNQCWTKTNLRVAAGTYSTEYVENETDPYYYIDNGYNDSIYGYYYNWPAANLACPDGWHLPSDAEWTIMTDYVNTQSAYVCEGGTDSIAKALASTDGWATLDVVSPCAPADQTYLNNATGFGGFPAGSITHLEFGEKTRCARFWTSTKYTAHNDERAWFYSLLHNSPKVSRMTITTTIGHSVRCVKGDATSGGGETTNSCPSVSLPSTTFELTKDDNNVYYTEFNYTPGSGNETVTATYATTGGGTFTCANCLDVQAPDGGNEGIISVFVPDQNLSPAEQLVVTITIASDACDNDLVLTGTYEETQQIAPIPTTFTCGTDKMEDADHNFYETVQIGNQCWTKTNMRVAAGTYSEAYVDSYTVPYYYINNGYNDSIYGYYYNWPAANSACPNGWHLPSDEDWTTMTDYVKTQNAYVCEEGTDSIAKALASTDGWITLNVASPCAPADQNTYVNNATGFGGFPAGAINHLGFVGRTENARFWTSTEFINPDYGEMVVFYSLLRYSPEVSKMSINPTVGYSVRCVKGDAISGGGETTTTSVQVGDFYCTDGSFVPAVDYANSGKTAQGIVFHTWDNGQHGWVVSIENEKVNTGTAITEQFAWSSVSNDIAALENYVSTATVYEDTAGYQNTQKILAAGNAETYPAAYAVDFANGWYLPAAGQWYVLTVNRQTVSGSLTRLGLSYDNNAEYWTSTEYNIAHAWTAKGIGAQLYKVKSTEVYVRAVRSF